MEPAAGSGADAARHPQGAAVGPFARLTLLKGGLAIGFALPFMVGVAYRVAGAFGWTADFGAVRLLAELFVIGALLMLALRYERLPLGSLGIHRVRIEEIYFGTAAGAALVGISVLTAMIVPRRGSGSGGGFVSIVSVLAPADYAGLRGLPMWLAFAVLLAAVAAEELAARGYAIRRLRALTGNGAWAAAAALAIDLIARLPLWGFRYALVTGPAEIALVALYLWRRQLLTCVVAHTIMSAAMFAAFLAFVPGAAATHPGGGAPGEQDAAAKLRRALGEPTGPGADAARRAQALYRKRDYRGALDEIDEAIRLEPKNPAYVEFRGNINVTMLDYRAAIADFTRMIALNPKDDSAYRARGITYMLGNDYKDAAADFEAAIKLAPADAENIAQRAALHFRRQEYNEAVSDYEKAIALAPSNSQYLLDESFVLQHAGEIRRALAVCDRAVALFPNKPDGYECRSNVYQVTGNRDGVINNLGAAIERDPDNAALYSTRAKSEMDTGRWKEAHDDFENVAMLLPDDPRICDGAAWVLATASRDELRDGKAAVALAARENEVTGYRVSRYLETLAAAYAEAGDFRSAVKWEKAAMTAPDANDPDEIRSMRQILHSFETGSAWRESATRAYASRTYRAAVIAAIATLVLALVGFIAVAVVLARWLLRRTRRVRPAPV